MNEDAVEVEGGVADESPTRAKVFAVGSVALHAFTQATEADVGDVLAMTAARQKGIDDVIDADGVDALKSGEIEVGCALPGPRVALPAVQPVERAKGVRLAPLHAPVFRSGDAYTYGGVEGWPATAPDSVRELTQLPCDDDVDMLNALAADLGDDDAAGSSEVKVEPGASEAVWEAAAASATEDAARRLQNTGPAQDDDVEMEPAEPAASERAAGDPDHPPTSLKDFRDFKDFKDSGWSPRSLEPWFKDFEDFKDFKDFKDPGWSPRSLEPDSRTSRTSRTSRNLPAPPSTRSST